jgi:diadenosine tetraphosphate (Ap4A) HIT family hydrolase
MSSACPFCTIDQDRILFEDQFCFSVYDGYPVSEGHTLLISKRHICSFFDTTADEKAALLSALEQAKNTIEQTYSPDSYNIGINDGVPAGQTIPHLHIHVIPRYKNDVVDPRGGIRWVLPEKADYWSMLK